MERWRLWRQANGLALLIMLLIGGTGTVFAATSTSPNYQMVESQFGSSDNNETCSDEFCAQATLGDLAVGGSADGNTTAEFGSVTPNEPSLDVIVEPGESSLGILTTEQTATKSAVIKVRNYLSNGYILQINGSPPKYGNHTLATQSTPTASTPGTEQFGINAVANTSPSVGSDPIQQPSSEFSFGTINSAYNTPNLFRYASEAIVAQSNSSSGQTDYTISMIVNISNSTPAGRYAGDFSAVVVPVY